uniref:Asparagine synthetase domain-containing protein n=1 Tax=Setaria digitata TaxID=48799 RepID=A0A915PHT4_9BILA
MSCGSTVIDLERHKIDFPTSLGSMCYDEYLKILVRKLNACKLISEIIDVLDDLIGDWAVIYYREDFKKVLVGRDIFGRKSLVWTRMGEKFHFSNSICHRQCKWYDVPPGTLTIFDLCSEENTVFHVFEVSEPWMKQFNKLRLVQRQIISERFMLSHELPPKNVDREVVVKIMLERLKEAVHRTFSNLDKSVKCILLSFSGGVDSLLIAHVMSHCIPSDVIFDLNYDEAPDRQQSKKAFKYLKSCYPERSIRLLLVNVDLSELIHCRKKYIANAVAPACSVLDDSIGCVQWFAARGEGLLFEGEEEVFVAVKSEARIVVVGSGADELFGGYMRHRTTYLKEGRNAVVEELCEELRKIGEKNLGRDDRVVSSLGKDLRAPFLDDLFVEWVTSLPLEYKSDFTQPRGIGEKWLIRETLRATRLLPYFASILIKDEPVCWILRSLSKLRLSEGAESFYHDSNYWDISCMDFWPCWLEIESLQIFVK